MTISTKLLLAGVAWTFGLTTALLATIAGSAVSIYLGLTRPIGNLTTSAERITAAEESLRSSEARSRSILETAPDGIVTLSEDGVVESVNSAAAALFAYEAEDLVGRDYSGLMLSPTHGGTDGYSTSDLSGDGMLVKARLREVVGRRADGSTFPMQLSVSELRVGEQRGFTWIVRDLTEVKEAQRELEELNRTLEQQVAERTAALEGRAQELARSNEELEQFAYVASHDLQEPLRMVASFTQLLERRYEGELDEQAHEYIAYAVDGAQRMQGLINDLLSYSRVGTRGKELQHMEVGKALDVALANLWSAIEESGAEVTHDRLPPVRGDATQIAQLLQNLIGNAIKFRGQDTPRVHVGARQLDGFWEISVSDNGIGIEPEYAERIFVIFQRLHTRGQYSGTGIGLAICKKVVERHGGRIWVESEPGEGATFHFTLKAASEARVAA